MPRRLLIAFVALAVLLCASSAFAKKQGKAAAQVDAISAEYAKAVQLVNERHWNDAITALTSVIGNPATPPDMLPFASTPTGARPTPTRRCRTKPWADLTQGHRPQADYNRRLLRPGPNFGHAEQACRGRGRSDQGHRKHQERYGPGPVLQEPGIELRRHEPVRPGKADFIKAKQIDPSIKIPMHYKPMLQQ